MEIVRTVLGDIPSQTLGIVDCHNHLIKNGGPEGLEHSDFIMRDVDAAIAECWDFYRCGGGTLCIMDPPNVGRDVAAILKIAKALASKVNIILATGFHKAKFYDPYSSWLNLVPTKEIIDQILAEINVGLDLYNYSGPVIKRCEAKAGIIKAGISYGCIDRLEFKALEIAAVSSIVSGCPILIHTQLGTMAYEAAKFLLDFGVNPDKIQLSHLNKNPDRFYYAKIISELKVNLCFDGPDRVKYYPDVVLAENLKFLIDQGYGDHLTLSLDSGRILYQKYYGLTRGKFCFGFAYLFERFLPLLRKIGIKQTAIDKMLITNPQRILAFDQPRNFSYDQVHQDALAIKKELKV